MLKNPQVLCAIVVALATIALPQSTQGGNIPILNYNFANPVLTPPGNFAGVTPDWTSGPGADNGTQNFAQASVYPGGVPDGVNGAYLNNPGTTLFQTLTGPSSNLAVGTYVLTAYVGWRQDNTPSPTYDLQFGVNAPGFTLLADNSSLPLVQGSFTPVTVTYIVTASNPFIGDPITVLIMNGASSPHQLDATAFTLTGPTAVPEPSSLVLMGIGGVAGLAFALARRRARVA